MIVRQAHFIGCIHDGQEDAFYNGVRQVLMPMWQRFPGLTKVEVLFPESADAGALPIALSLLMHFRDEAGLAEALGSEIRMTSRRATEDLLKLFDGHVEHHVFTLEAANAAAAG